jgi:bacillolysin
MTLLRGSRVAISAAITLVLCSVASFVAPTAAAATPSYVFLEGSRAANFQLPADEHLVNSWTLFGSDVTVTRYQQVVSGAAVADGQLSVVKRGDTIVLVVGRHSGSITLTARPTVTASQASAIAVNATAASARARPINQGAAGNAANVVARQARLNVNPDNGRPFYLVESYAPATRMFYEIDATNGQILSSWSGIDTAAGDGKGVKGDTKSLSAGSAVSNVALTSLDNGTWRLASADGRISTFDARNATSYGAVSDKAMSDAAKPAWNNDNIWIAALQAAAVDAQYYAALTLRYYKQDMGFDPLAAASSCSFASFRNVVHFGTNYDNAFWDGSFMVYGDGDGGTDAALSAGQDVVTHELSHAVTECRTALEYHHESGALNEAFSDIIATAAEWKLEEPIASKCRLAPGQTECADWFLGEDIYTTAAFQSIRSLAQPAIDGQPSHYADRSYSNPNCVPSDFNDQCGVHTNSGIANQAFYLMAHGGRNARCSGPNDAQADCSVLVPGMGIDDAAKTAFAGWLLLTSRGQFCQARDATVAMAHVLFPNSAGHLAAADLAWRSVGVKGCAGTNEFSLGLQPRSLVTRPGADATVAVSIARSAGNTKTVALSVSDPSPAAVSYAPGQSVDGTQTSATIKFSVPVDAPSGTYPIIVSGATDVESHSAALTLIVDADPPTATVTAVRPFSGDTVGLDSKVPLHVSWTTADALSGVAAGSLSVDSTHLANGIAGTATYPSVDGTHSFQASATDVAGNLATSPALPVNQTSFQESALAYKSTWSVAASVPAWGTTRFSKTRGATARLAFNGTDVAWVSTLGPRRGKAKVYIDGILRGTVDLLASTVSPRRIVFSASGLTPGAHSIKIYVNGTLNRPRIDVDGFVVLTQ